MAEWEDLFYEYRQIYNFEARKRLYTDIERDNQINAWKHKPVSSIRDL